MNFFAELKRRNVYRAAAFYAASAWLLAQIATQVFPLFHVPERMLRGIVVALVLGFPLALLFSWFYEWTPEGIKRESEVDRSQSITGQTGRRLDRWIMATLGLAVVLLLTDKFVLRKDTASVDQDKSIAVLPFANTSGDAGNEYFSDGLSEELISSLSRLSDLKVIGRTSSFQFKGKTEDSASIGQKLGVVYLLEGSVRKSADRVRIAAQLVKSADGANVWSESYDRELKDIFAVQAEIAGVVAEQLQVALLGKNTHAATLPVAAEPSNRNFDAYTAFLQGNASMLRHTSEDQRKAIAYYEEAVRLDPSYALAYANLADAQVQLVTIFTISDRAEWEALVANARQNAARALALDPMLGRAYQSAAFIAAVVDFDLVAADKGYRRAVELAPQDSGTYLNLAILNASLGRLEDAVEYGRRSITLDPLNSSYYVYQARTLVALGRYDEAEAILRKAIEFQPQAAQSHVELATIEILRGNASAALDLARQETDRFWRDFAIALAESAGSDQAEADRTLADLIDHYADTGAFQIAQVHALRKDTDRMFESLERGLVARDPGVTMVLYAPFLGAYRDDPRFAAFCRKLNLPAPGDAAPVTASKIAVPKSEDTR
jgi:TolB-like protein/Tfp pilus assembly protein PilF